MNNPGTVEVPFGVVTATGTGPAACAGVVAEIAVSESTVNDVAAVPPNDTPVAPVNPVPVIVTAVPPLTGPVNGATNTTTGGDPVGAT